LILAVLCLCATALSYYLGVRSPGRRFYGTGRGWTLALLLGAAMAVVFYTFSALGLIASLDQLLSDF
jgi:hypothetical protein